MRRSVALVLACPLAALLALGACTAGGTDDGADDDDDNSGNGGQSGDDDGGGNAGANGFGGDNGGGAPAAGGDNGNQGGAAGMDPVAGMGGGEPPVGGMAGGETGGMAGTPAGGTGGMPNTEPPAPGPVCPAAGKCKFLSVGDGLAAGTQGSGSESYRRATSLASGNASKIEWIGSKGAAPYKHEGENDRTISQLSGAIDGLMDTLKPNVVVLHIGTEDLEKGANKTTIFNGVKGVVMKIRAKLPDAFIFIGGMGRERNANSNNNSTFNQKALDVDRELGGAKRAEFGERTAVVTFPFNVMFDATGLVNNQYVSGTSYYPNSSGYNKYGTDALGKKIKAEGMLD